MSKITVIEHKVKYDNTEIFKVNAEYFKLTDKKKIELLGLMKDWINDQLYTELDQFV
jgi:hypothetical protein